MTFTHVKNPSGFRPLHFPGYVAFVIIDFVLPRTLKATKFPNEFWTIRIVEITHNHVSCVMDGVCLLAYKAGGLRHERRIKFGDFSSGEISPRI